MVDKATKKKIKEAIKWYVDRIYETRYAYDKLLKLMVGSKKYNSFGDTAMFCSEFVDSVLKYAKIDISGKSSSNTAPDDLASFRDKNNFFQVYEGKISEYDPNKIDDMIENLRQNTEYRNLKSQTRNSMKNPLDHPIGNINHLPDMNRRIAAAAKDKIFKKKVLKEDGTFEYVDEIIEEGGETENE